MPNPSSPSPLLPSTPPSSHPNCSGLHFLKVPCSFPNNTMSWSPSIPHSLWETFKTQTITEESEKIDCDCIFNHLIVKMEANSFSGASSVSQASVSSSLKGSDTQATFYLWVTLHSFNKCSSSTILKSFQSHRDVLELSLLPFIKLLKI